MTKINCDDQTVLVGETWVRYQCNITVNNVYDTNTGKITVKPSIGTLKTQKTLNVTQGDCFIFITSGGNFRITIVNCFVGISRLMKIECCDEV